ncbi:hypothetical protein Tco_1248977 [Tanacetum coccineum]
MFLCPKQRFLWEFLFDGPLLSPMRNVGLISSISSLPGLGNFVISRLLERDWQFRVFVKVKVAIPRSERISLFTIPNGWDDKSSFDASRFCVFLILIFQWPPALLPLMINSLFPLPEDNLLLPCLSKSGFRCFERIFGNNSHMFYATATRPRLGSGIPDLLRTRLGPSLFLRSPLLIGVPDSECCEASSKLRPASLRLHRRWDCLSLAEHALSLAYFSRRTWVG